jgi:hypothetical protein
VGDRELNKDYNDKAFPTPTQIRLFRKNLSAYVSIG